MNEQEEYKEGDVVYHKSDGRPMVVIGFPKAKNDARSNQFDKSELICRYLSSVTDQYVTFTFYAFEVNGKL